MPIADFLSPQVYELGGPGSGRRPGGGSAQKAAESSAKAAQKSTAASGQYVDPKLHLEAAEAHHEAAKEQRAVGNPVKAQLHDTNAKGHEDAAKDVANKLSFKAHEASGKAFVTGKGEDHLDAMYAHKKAGIAQHAVGNHEAGDLHEKNATHHATLHDKNIPLSRLISPAVYAMSAEGCKWTKIREAIEKQGKKLTPQGIKKLSAMSQKQIDALTEKDFAAFCMSAIDEPALSLLAFAGLPFYQLPGIEGPNNAAVEPTGPNPGGKPALSTLKDVLAEGSFVHPVHKWKLNVDGPMMDKLCAAFDNMKADGVKVPIYADHKPSATTHLGYVTGMIRGGPEALKKYPELANLPADKAPLDPKKLYAIHQFNDEKAVALATGVGQVSVLIDKNMKAGNGKSYGPAIRHSAITAEPIVPNQDGFCKLSLGDSNLINVACFSCT